jgi:hypothetical protein
VSLFLAFMAVKLSTLSIVLGLVMAAINLFGLFSPSQFKDMVRKLPRSVSAGYVLMIAGTVWFIWNVSNESLSDFESLKPFLFMLFVAVGVGSCFFVQDFLAVRGLAVLMLLLGKLMVDTERWADTEWRLVIAAWAYLLVIFGIWFTISPWRMRDIFNWATATERRIRLGSAVRCAFGLFVAFLGFKVF